ncbi:MAG: SpoIIE family protein phosphatase [Desulfuromonadaceae bacterium]|nr:SpoIIE family protein phosphatase [Desulfuromonadaceae bacterium]MDD5106456.1 SpoIIE family protein phosphatase [Desulfuromonadaceae bacterium]
MQLHSLKPKFILIIVSLSLFVGLATLATFYLSSNSIIKGFALRFATKEALLEKNKIMSLIDREVVLARKMADDPTLKRWAVHEEQPELKREAFEELESYRRLYRDKSFFIALAGSRHYYVYNKEQGHDRVELTTLSSGNPMDKWFFEALRNQDGYALNLDYDSTLKQSKVWINVIMKGRQGEKTGICGGGITITDFLNEIVFSHEKGLSTMLVDQSGIIQAHEDRAIVEHNASARSNDKKITVFSLMDLPDEREHLKQAISDLKSSKNEVAAFPVLVGGKVFLAAVSHLQGIGWFNVVLVDVSQVFSMRVFLPIIAIMLLSFLLIITTLALLMNRMVLVPLTRLTVASREVAGGRYDIAVPVTGRDELGELSGSFNRMAAMILDHTANLEMKVRERTDQLSSANRMLEESQNRIMESIKYARIIQSSILPDDELCRSCLGDNFVIYRPKELVGGDFYYLRRFPGHFLLAVIDCTGHGVPGAFMTMTVNAVLNHVVDMVCNDDPARILAELNRVLRRNLNFRDVDAGLDIALCMVDRDSRRLVFAGAGLSLYLASAADVREIRGDNQRVGYKGSRLDYTYRNHEPAINAGECCYLTSDGLLDLPGGDKGYGFGAERFRTLLAGTAGDTMQSRGEMIAQVLSDYQGDFPSRDDMTLIAFRL